MSVTGRYKDRRVRAVSVISGDALRSLARPAQTGRDWVEARLLDLVHRRRDDPAILITWFVVRISRQPDEALERLSWQPGARLPDDASWAECQVEVTHRPD